MAEKTEAKVNEDSHESGSSFYTMARKMMLAAIGAAVVAQDEIEQFLSRMVEKGEIAEKDARSLMKEMIEKREKMLKERRAERAKKPAIENHKRRFGCSERPAG